jgi:hypothetical protein
MTRFFSVRRASVGIFVATAAVLTGCSSSPPSSSSTTTTAASTTTSTSTSTSSTSAPTTTTTTSATGVTNLSVTDQLRTDLLDAGAAHHSLPPSDYTGLQPGLTYYAYDASTKTYWAGAALMPSSSSEQAQVSNQDDGSYLLFTEPSGGTWTVYDDGLGGVGGTACPVTVPPGVLQAWGWTAGSCKPPNS